MNRFVTLIDDSLVIRKSVVTCLSHNEREQQGLEREALARRWNATHSERSVMSSKRPVASDDLVDMELHCVTCGARLYLALPQAHAVIASLERTGAAVLICVCGQAQLIRRKLHKRHD